MRYLESLESWLENDIETIEEGFWKNAAVGAALLGTGVGIGSQFRGSKPDVPNSITSPDVQKSIGNKTATDAKNADLSGELKGWNDQIGDFTAVKSPSGETIFRTKKGDFKQHRNVLGKLKYVPVK